MEVKLNYGCLSIIIPGSKTLIYRFKFYGDENCKVQLVPKIGETHLEDVPKTYS